MLKKRNPAFENCFISGFKVDSPYVIVPKEINVSNLNIDFEYEDASEIVTAKYFFESHLVGQVDLIVGRIQPESNSLENTVQIPLHEENREIYFRWRYVVFVIIIVAFIIGAFVQTFFVKHRNRNKKKRNGRRIKRK